LLSVDTIDAKKLAEMGARVFNQNVNFCRFASDAALLLTAILYERSRPARASAAMMMASAGSITSVARQSNAPPR
jgi:hypothetical protein